MPDEYSEKLPSSISRPLFGAAVLLLVLIITVVLWAVCVPIAITIHASGTLISSIPNYEIQHPYGGQISWVDVKAQDHIETGQVLLRINVQNEQMNLIELDAQIETAALELDEIETLLSDRFIPEDLNEMVDGQFVQQRKSIEIRKKLRVQSVHSLNARIRSGRQQIAFLEQRAKLLSQLEKNQRRLKVKGLTLFSDTARISDELLQVSGDLEQQRSAVLALRLEAEQAENESELLLFDFRAEIMERQKQNQTKLAELRQRRVALLDVIEHSEIVAPVSGQIQSLSFDTTQMYADRGETLLIVSQRLQKPKVKLLIPVNAIDQVFTGITGKLVIRSLPNRDVPELNIIVISIAPEADKDQDGNTIGYSATAEIEAKDLAQAHKVLKDRLRLSIDMPVNVSLSGRETTFASYLISPFLNIFSKALQD